MKTVRKEVIKTKVNYYRFNLDVDEFNPSGEQQIKDYNELCERLRSQGLTKFDSICSTHSRWYKESIAPLDNKKIQLETKYIFNNQWNTRKPDLRVFDWSEAIYPNRNIKEGMWLEQTDEMKEVRETWHRCAWCGETMLKSDGKYCTEKCKVGMEDHLKER